MEIANQVSSKKSFSCIIPAYNAGQTIERALASVLQTPQIDEVVVVDDGSVDDTAQKVKNFVADASVEIKFTQQANGGAAAARNTGLSLVEREWVTFLDADDEMLPDTIDSKMRHLANCPDPEKVAAVHGSFIRSDTGRTAQFSETFEKIHRDGIGREGGAPGGVVSYVFLRKTLMNSGGFRDDLRMFEDFELILRLIAEGARVVGCNVPGFVRHYTENSLSRGTAIEAKLLEEQQFLKIASQDQLLGRKEIARRSVRVQARKFFFFFKRR